MPGPHGLGNQVVAYLNGSNKKLARRNCLACRSSIFEFDLLCNGFSATGLIAVSYQLYWGDLHNHCSISYGHGTAQQALLRARQQLDFCSITGHAFWPDMPTDRERYGEIIDYHHEGFARLARNWPTLLSLLEEATTPGEFLAIPSYEWHSCEFGDHNVYAAGPELPLLDAPNLPQLRKQTQPHGAILLPHHIGYAAGYRGINWAHFQAGQSPLVEIFSLHGCSESDEAPYPMLHDMGPRDGASTAAYGWGLGHRFGIIGSTDHHAAYPGSHGDGRLGVYAEGLSRSELWEALLGRRVFAATGDRIDPRFQVDGAWMGEEITSAQPRRIAIDVRGSDRIQLVELLKNNRPLARLFPTDVPTSDQLTSNTAPHTYRLRINWGWGRKDIAINWDARLSLSPGTITAAETCFSGQAIVAPQADAHAGDRADLPHALLDHGPQQIAWRSETTGNLSMRHPTTQAISLEISAPPGCVMSLEVNGQRFQHELGDLIRQGHSHFLRGWLSEAIAIGPAVPVEATRVTAEVVDEPESEVDFYRLRVFQNNGQCAWTTPVWVER